MDRKEFQNQYIPHNVIQNAQVQFYLKRINDYNKVLNNYLDEPSSDANLEIMVNCELIVNGTPIIPSIQRRFQKKMVFDQDPFIFNYKYQDLSYNSLISLTIWCPNKQQDPEHPLGSTVISIFDDELKLRQGTYQLHIWPNTLPDISFDSNTPALVQDQNIDGLNFSSKKRDILQKSVEMETESQAFVSLNLSIHYKYCRLPAAFIELEFPKFQVPVFYQDCELQSERLQNSGSGSYIFPASKFFLQPHNFSDIFINEDFESNEGYSDPIQDQYFLILRQDDNVREVKPDQIQLAEITNILKRPLLGELKAEEQLLLYRFRYSLQQNKGAVAQFLCAVNWQNKKEETQALLLLQSWANCNFEEVLTLLSGFFCSNEVYNKKFKKPVDAVLKIRQYAVDILRSQSDSIISSILLQLVQALRYQPFSIDDSVLMKFLIQRASQNTQIATMMHWYLLVECDQKNQAPLTEQSSSTAPVVNSSPEKRVIQWFNIIYQEFLSSLSDYNPELHENITNQLEFRNRLETICNDLQGNQKKERPEKIEELYKILKTDEFKQSKFKAHPFCLDPTIILLESITHEEREKDKNTIFKSAMMPMQVMFNSRNELEKQTSPIQFIFKTGDDLRQDQLVLQVFNLMDTLLKGVNQDMKLSPYKILACSKNDGFMEFVQNTVTLQELLLKSTLTQFFTKLSSEIDNPVYDYMREAHATKQEIQSKIQEILKEDGINKTIMQNYILSCAGYCVLTYFLGIGDRHLENIMIDKTGQFLHIDFGFILGNDPQPYPPPLKLCKEMVDGMGGRSSENYKFFQQKCVDAFIYLRKHAQLVVNLFLLMIDSGIKDLTPQRLEKLADQFYLEENDEAAEKHFLAILDQSVKALFPVVTDQIHIWATYFRK